jgi:hypothetical protein
VSLAPETAALVAMGSAGASGKEARIAARSAGSESTRETIGIAAAMST